MRGGGPEGERSSDTALCVAMVQAQSELHSSFAAQLVNYPQTAVLTCSKPLFAAAPSYRLESRGKLPFFIPQIASKMQPKINAPQRIEQCNRVSSAASAMPLVIKDLFQPRALFSVVVAAHRGPADPDQPAYKTQYGPLWINIHHLKFPIM